MLRTANFRIYMLVILLILVWGICWPINKMGLAFISPIWFASFRLLIGTVSLFFIVLFQGKFVFPDRRDLPNIIVFGVLQMALFMSLITIGLDHVNAGRSAVLVYTTPIWVAPIAILFFHEKFSIYTVVGFLLGIVGILILFSPWGVDWSNKSELFGNGILLLAALCWAISILCARNMKWYRTPLELVPWQLLLGTVLVFSAAYLIQPTPIIIWNHTLKISLLFTGILGAAFGYWGSMVVSKELPSLTVSLFYLTIPVSGLIFSLLLLHEPITLLIALAMLFILSGVTCVAWGNRQAK